MKLIICGSLIDVSMIYAISDIMFGNWDNYVGFEIYSLNQKIVTISENYENSDNKEEITQKVEKVREELISYWSNNQSATPKINF